MGYDPNKNEALQQALKSEKALGKKGAEKDMFAKLKQNSVRSQSPTPARSSSPKTPQGRGR